MAEGENFMDGGISFIIVAFGTRINVSKVS